ncbi:MAG: hypothetical protein A2X48_17915 [Lentisphaerae bacterium GWF2_49_21]|nr:MAG: hypothetical protein A2X48_17915 [Lentisphaerae bacterium GWF2_49_21]
MAYDISDLYKRYPELKKIGYSITDAFSILKRTVSKDGIIFICGNGGSASDSEHIAGELLKSFLIRRKASGKVRKTAIKVFGEKEGRMICDGLEDGIRAISLNGHPSFATAFANDSSPSMVFAQQLHVLGRKGDVLIAISTSGNADNVLNAIKVARIKGITSILLTGALGGECAKKADLCIKAPANETYKIQEYHLPIYHALCAMLEGEFYGS